MNFELLLTIYVHAFIIGAGSATVIYILGFLSVFRNFWFKVLNGTDRIAIPMLWAGSLMLLLGYYFSMSTGFLNMYDMTLKLILWGVMTLNGLYLSIFFAPVIRKYENIKDSTILMLPSPHKYLIFIAALVSFLTWYGQTFFFIAELAKLIN